jgi:two-component system sensor histidine kinase SenX3
MGRPAEDRRREDRLRGSVARLTPGDPSPANGLALDDLLDTLDVAAERAVEGAATAERSLARLVGALDRLSQGLIICDQEGVVVHRNARAVALVRGTGSDVIAQQAVGAVLAAAIAGGRPEQTLELFAPHRRTLLIRAFPLRGPGGAVAVVDDVSQLRRLEDVRRDFVANVSHELKTPVGALSLLAETLDGEEDPEVVARLSSRVASEAERLGRIIDDLLDLSRIETNESPVRERVAVRRVIDDAVQPLRATAASHGIELSVQEVPASLAVPGDRRDLISAVANLVDNAIKYSEPGSRVTVEVRGQADWVEIAVTDQGIGIPSRDIERVFERFYRVDRARSRSTGGTGLGLAIVRHVAVNQGGSVEVRSVEGEGSTFTLRLRAEDRGTPGPGDGDGRG